MVGNWWLSHVCTFQIHNHVLRKVAAFGEVAMELL